VEEVYMGEKAKVRGSEPPNEGEGDRTAARRYNEAQRVVQSGQVEEKTREAEKPSRVAKRVRWSGLKPSASSIRRPKIRKLPISISQTSISSVR
jgi:hypothetical protein